MWHVDRGLPFIRGMVMLENEIARENITFRKSTFLKPPERFTALMTPI